MYFFYEVVFVLQVYGEIFFDLVDQMIKFINFSEDDYFIDLGSGEFKFKKFYNLQFLYLYICIYVF